jgi:hypothetical protein
MTMMFSGIPNCTHIILGISHDNGYARLLYKLKNEGIAPGRVFLLEGPPLAGELQPFSTSMFPRLKIPNLFLEYKPELRNPKQYVSVAADSVLHMDGKPKLSSSQALSLKSISPDSGNYDI